MPTRAHTFALLALSGWLLTLATIVWPGGSQLFLVTPIIFLLVATVSPRIRRRAIALAVASMPLMALLLATHVHHELRNPPALADQAGQQATFHFVNERTIVAGDRFARGTIQSVTGRAVESVPAMAFFDEATHRLPPGVTLELTGSATPGGRLDTRAWLVYVDSLRVHAHAPGYQEWADGLRADFLARALALGGDGGALLPGLSLGDTEAVSESLEFDMRRAALSHLVAVSGANVALVVGLAVLVTALLGGGVWWRVGTGVLTLALFILLVTPEPSVVRASVMATVVLLAAALGRPQAGLVALSLTVWLVLLINPWHAVDIAFVLSVAATAGIVLGFGPTSRTLSAIMPRALALLLALPLVAQLAVQPFIILLRPSIPSFGIIANALAAPFVPLVTIAGLVGSVSGPVTPGVADIAARLGWLPASAIALIARAVGRLPGVEVAWPAGPLGFVLAAGLSAGGFLLLTSRRRRLGASVAIVAMVIALSVTHLPVIFSRLASPSQWQIAQCDVGQGDALLVNTERGVVAIDTGDDEMALRGCLASLSVTKVAVLVLTHFDRDHVGQTAVFEGITDLVLTGPPENSHDQRRLAQLAAGGARIRQVTEGDRMDLGDYSLTVEWPSTQPLSKPGNDSSVVVRLEPQPGHGRLSLLALGDLGERAQRMLLARMTLGNVDVVKVSHHGSADQSADLYRALRASVALIGVGRENDYGHPAASTLAMVSTQAGTVLRSDQHGLVTLHRDESGIQIWSEALR